MRNLVSQRWGGGLIWGQVMLVVLGWSAGRTFSAAGEATAGERSQAVRQLLNEHCTSCHGGVKRAGGLSFIARATTLEPTKSGAIAIKPGDPGGSELMRRILAEDEDERMPPPEHGPRLASEQIDLLRAWIAEGAPWETHWAYLPPRAPASPSVTRPEWCRQPLDRFILARLDKEGLTPAPEADRVAWLRRVTFDLIGLPPTLDEVRDFVDDPTEQAYERVVDRLLQSPHFGERWAAPWLDLARYADSQGYEKDGGRTIWPYRDWLIRAFNQDLPFDEFTVRQLAGDLLPDATLEDEIATAFHRNTPTNTEGGTDDEEYRLTAVIDRVATTWKTWQGISFNCVQCHSHPYEPINHDEFYRFLAFFNTSQDWDLTSEEPRLEVPRDPEQFAEARALDGEMHQWREEEHRRVERVRGRQDGKWTPLTPSSAVSTLQTKLVVRPVEGHGAEVWTEGTVSHDSEFTIELPVPAGRRRLTALRVEVLPRDPARALYNPELGFVVSHVRAQLLTPQNESEVQRHEESLAEARAAQVQAKDQDQEHKDAARRQVESLESHRPGEVDWIHALGDEIDPFNDAERSLHPDKQGWGAWPRLAHPRELILLPRGAVEIPEGARLRLVVRQEAAPNDMMPLVMNRSRYAMSDQDAWQDLLREETFGRGRERRAELNRKRKAIASVGMPVMREQDEDLARGTAVFVRGQWLNKGDPVRPGVPQLFPPLAREVRADRLAMARWLVSPQNPLTARVAVNRFWEQMFGIGLVETVEDFGSSGQAPSHPALLDDLAVRFQREMGWSVKALLREIALSAAYRQDAAVSDWARAKDPRNRLLSRGPRQRLSAEMIRDNALAVSGLLSEKMFGPPVMPEQPEGIWRAARSSLKWEPSQGEDAHRRAVYTYWRRSSPYPSLLTFDAPNRLVCTARRVPTSTPLQALVTLNDPVYIECARALARRMAAVGAENVAAQVARGFAWATGRPPGPDDRLDLVELYEVAQARYASDEALASQLGAKPEEAALTLVANAILNLDEVLTK